MNLLVLDLDTRFQTKDLMKKKTNWLHVLLVGVFLIIIPSLPIIVYVKTFYQTDLSSNLSDWSNLGGFLSGTVGIYLSLLNIIIFIFLTIRIGKVQNEFSEQGQKINQSQYEFQTRYFILKELSEPLNEISKAIYIENEDAVSKLIMAHQRYLFFQSFVSQISNSSQEFQDMDTHIQTMISFYETDDTDQDELIKEKFQLLRNRLIASLSNNSLATKP